VLFEEPPEHAEGVETHRSSHVYEVPIGDEENPLGYVELRESPDFSEQTIETTMRAFIFAGIGSILLAGFVGLLVSRYLATPLVHLTQAAGEMEGGDLSVRAREYGRDEIGQLARQFNQMAERLEHSFAELEAERDTLRRFIADASHELRTPITALRNFIELLQGKAQADPEAQQEFLTESETQLNRLAWITQNLLDLSRLEAGLTPVNLTLEDIGQLLAMAASSFDIPAEEKGVKLVVVPPQPSFEILVDRELLGLALSNLIDNALKFTPRGGEVELGAEFSDQATRIWVRDSGSGIDAHDVPHVFDRFYRGRNVSVEGSGLGLAMVSSVSEAHGGQVKVESELGAGSTFLIELPHQLTDEHGAEEQ
jgi:signal transduction histidine kinase